jgi:uncharacterized RDD family membrane protein YckC
MTMENADTPQTYSLCGREKYMEKKAKSLYGQSVCKKCYDGFTNRRQAAFLVDLALWYGIITALGFIVGRPLPQQVETLLALCPWVAFLFKDGFAGHSPGKALMGIQVVNEESGNPTGFGVSFKRNVLLIVPFMILIVAFQLRAGYRVGDRWARSKVIWKKYRDKAPFVVGNVVS